MHYQVICDGSYPVLEVSLQQGEILVAEAAAMAWMDPHFTLNPRARGGVKSSVTRKILGGESFFQNEFTSKRDGARIGLTPGPAGDIRATDMDEGPLVLEEGAFLASGPQVLLEPKFQGMKGLFAEGLFLLQASGTGTLFWYGYGDIQQIDVAGDYLVDNGYAVAWDARLDYSVERSGKTIRNFLFGDQLIVRFTGQGRLWVQSRSPRSLANAIYPYRPLKDRKGD